MERWLRGQVLNTLALQTPAVLIAGSISIEGQRKQSLFREPISGSRFKRSPTGSPMEIGTTSDEDEPKWTNSNIFYESMDGLTYRKRACDDSESTFCEYPIRTHSIDPIKLGRSHELAKHMEILMLCPGADLL